MSETRISATLISAIVMVAGVAIGLLTLKDGDPERDESHVPKDFRPPSGQKVLARLWEDPLEAVQAEDNRRRGQTNYCSPSTGSVSNEIGRTLAAEGLTNLLLLVVPGPSTHFPHEREKRLRLRYAVQMAMADQS